MTQDPQDLISKKDLLELTGISYGQLYRWKRKNLIPEEWFVRKSTFTGQETFFPRLKILARIDKIKNMKDDLSLDALADVFSPVKGDIALNRSQLLEHNIVLQSSLELYIKKQSGPIATFSFSQILIIYVLDFLLQTGEINLEEGGLLIQTLSDHLDQFNDKPCELILIRKMGVSTFMLIGSASQYYFDRNAKVIDRMNLAGSMEELNLKLKHVEG
ncbi:YhbD family protein [Paenibacillus sp. N1-5-1-14]|uniref:YhbD family protein n=1 Tax=Paenibacillus radicibacter TaxID=2972488 RepID=UPI002158E9F2|nr:YhbD family protein [Paenibacillus radicibacter]MCR8641159.1 YhbD family protein [Paenibacillus radicibacter]